MDTIFMNSENSKNPKPHVLALKFNNKLDWRIGKLVPTLSNLHIYYTWKNIKSPCNSNKFKISTPTWNDNLNYQMDLIPYKTFKIILSIFKKNMGKVKACKNSERLWNEITQIVYCLHESKQITKKVYNNIINYIEE